MCSRWWRAGCGSEDYLPRVVDGGGLVVEGGIVEEGDQGTQDQRQQALQATKDAVDLTQLTL